MTIAISRLGSFALLGIVCASPLLSACGGPTTQEVLVSCVPPQSKQLTTALAHARGDLSNGCETSFDAYLQRLLVIAEGDPNPGNKRQFSDFLLWATEEGILSKRQAQDLYNRYFNVKYVSLRGDYNNCAYTCPIKGEVMAAMDQELLDKEQGLLKVSADQESYYRADRLLREAQLVLEATCSACPARR